MYIYVNISLFHLNMKVSDMLVISVTIKQRKRAVSKLMFNLYMNVSSMLVISVTLNINTQVI